MYGEELLEGSLPITLFLGIASLLCLYWYSTQNFDYWKKRGIPHAGPAIPFVGTLYPLLWKVSSSRHTFLNSRYTFIYGRFKDETSQQPATCPTDRCVSLGYL
ncbi:hypothetical protein AVEN_200229-1 [Araneus ventricosus]|uniref:Uncharacterized protein n=2 Tax=Araneus ventricosus TaxID=182803 RepID=A0A4Y2V9P8_ARAVE|nr:hypothetical protein AVEN_200229-1 [Araneus ventricosus]